MIRPGSPSPRVGAHGCSGKAKALLGRGWNSLCPSPPSPSQAGHVCISSPPGAGCVCRGLINPLGLFAPPGHRHPDTWAPSQRPLPCPVPRSKGRLLASSLFLTPPSSCPHPAHPAVTVASRPLYARLLLPGSLSWGHLAQCGPFSRKPSALAPRPLRSLHLLCWLVALSC